MGYEAPLLCREQVDVVKALVVRAGQGHRRADAEVHLADGGDGLVKIAPVAGVGHGHFYQPPREDPWLGRILPEGSAAPSVHWNARICRESYTPLARARRLDGQGHIVELLNCYEWMSFNAGPTLLSWMARSAPETYARILEADRASVKRLGHGNALAQIYHHVIMPLASELDKELEVAWAVDDFTARFGRAPEGLWLSETAVDTPTLEVLAAAGLRFTILAPSQAVAVSDDGRKWRDVDAGSLDMTEPYTVALPSGRSMS